jgi:hypothetical protein
MGTKGPGARALSAWIARAITSFPEPLSPSSRTLISDRAINFTVAITLCMAADR